MRRSTGGQSRKSPPAGETLRAAVTRAEHHAESLDMQDMARMLRVSYSSFRRAFLKETGLSPWQYLMSVRRWVQLRISPLGGVQKGLRSFPLHVEKAVA